MRYIAIFNRLAGIPNVALLVPLMVHTQVNKKKDLIENNIKSILSFINTGKKII